MKKEMALPGNLRSIGGLFFVKSLVRIESMGLASRWMRCCQRGETNQAKHAVFLKTSRLSRVREAEVKRVVCFCLLEESGLLFQLMFSPQARDVFLFSPQPETPDVSNSGALEGPSPLVLRCSKLREDVCHAPTAW